ncbi:GNAT family N-acetyltransferase [Sphingomonadaceae bacterium jetA1]|jgi:GNAT superfamily N-acetyltransferase|uniref:GNAT family N-acetyltransferase n=1 Tax=Facivitalis istanbulensis TaxID=3075838 RepID=UPI003482F0B9
MTIIDTDLLVTRTGVRLNVRPARPEDEPALAEFFGHVTPDDLRFRFLTGVREVGHERLLAMATANDARSESLIALDDGGAVLASAMLVGDAAGETAEAAIAVRGDHKGRGIGWTLLDHLVGHARRHGYAAIESIEDRANRDAIALEREMGFEAIPIDGEPALVRIRRELR